MEFQSGRHSVVEEKDRLLGGQRIRPHNATLPFDILGMIFHYVADGYSARLRSLILVCRSWNDAVCLHPTLWATIRVDCTLLKILTYNSTLTTPLVKSYIHSCLRWSGTAPLDVSVDLFPEELKPFTTSDNVLEIWSQLFLLVMDLIGMDGEHAVRWQSFTWRCHRRDYAEQVLSKLPLSLPILEILRFRGVRLDASQFGMFPHCPRLRTVELHQYPEQPLKNEDCLLVSDLFIATDLVWLSLDIVILSSFTNIRRLTLSTTLDGQALFIPDARVSTPNEVSLPRLQWLRLQGCLPPQMIECMVAPLLKELELDCSTSLELLGGVSLARTVETIRIAIPNLTRTLVPKQIRRLVNSTPTLKRLCVPNWFHNWLEHNNLHLGENVVVVIG